MRGVCVILFLLVAMLQPISARNRDYSAKAEKVLRSQILEKAAWALMQQPITVTASVSKRSAGGKHDFFSEGDYWWPDPKNSLAPYIQKDGLTNPDNFLDHRRAMIRFSQIVGALASAYKITHDKKYAIHALLHLEAWFIEPETLMNPNLLYAQAIQGRFTGRGIGIIDTIHLMEVAQGIMVMQAEIDQQTLAELKNWFSIYLEWLTTHPYGRDEMEAKNNHGTCWVMQVASFARLTGNQDLLSFCRERFKTVLLPNQMAVNGSFPLELARTKPYGYSLFNLDAMVMLCHILSDSKENVWEYRTADGKSIRKGVEFMFPYINNKRSWPFRKDVMYWDNWPVAQPALIFAAEAFNNRAWYKTWKKLDHSPEIEEVIRNLPIRNPVIWLN